MKKFFIVLTLLALLAVGCNVVTPTPVSTATPFGGVTETPTGIETSFPKTPEPTGTNTPESTVTPFILPSATATLPATPTQFVPPTEMPDCVTLPCGINFFFNGGFEIIDLNTPENRYDDRTPDGNHDILTAPFWNFEFLSGTSRRNPQGTLTAPEAGERLGQFYDYRVDGYTPNVNERAQVWFRPSAWVDAGVTQSVTILEGHRYAIGAAVSTWSAPDWEPNHHLSYLVTEDDKRNIQWSIRANYNDGKVYDGVVLETFDYDDGIYDFVLGPDGKNHFGGQLVTYFTAPTDSDADSSIAVNFGFTANNMWNLKITDYHIDNAFLYCLDCGFGNPLPTQDPNATPTQIVTIDDEWESVTIVAASLRVRDGANTLHDVVLNSDGTVKRVQQGQTLPVFFVYENETTGEVWAQLNNPDTCEILNVCGVNEWVAVRHPDCDNNICGILNK